MTLSFIGIDHPNIINFRYALVVGYKFYECIYLLTNLLLIGWKVVTLLPFFNK